MSYFQEKKIKKIEITERIKDEFDGLSLWMSISGSIGIIVTALSVFIAAFRENKLLGLNSFNSRFEVMSFFVTTAFSLFLDITLLTAAKFLKTGITSNEKYSFYKGLNKLNTYFTVICVVVIILTCVFAFALFYMLYAGGISKLSK